MTFDELIETMLSQRSEDMISQMFRIFYPRFHLEFKKNLSMLGL